MRRKRRTKKKRHYPLKEIKRLKHQCKYVVNSNAFKGAWDDFSWELQDIVDALNKLQNNHYHNTKPSNFRPGVMVDSYQARDLKGENVYTHFYVDPDSGELVINSFKRMRSKR